MTEPSRAPIRHQPALDGLRGVAVAGVLLFHGGHLTGGYLGVDAFFVLSGFLITTLLLVERDRHGRISLRSFWARRARRLLPALACVLAAVAVYAAFFAQRGEMPSVRGDAFSTIFYVANWHAIAAGHNYFAIFQSPSPLQHTWSLAIEEQFYLVWPLTLVLLLRRRRLDARATAARVLVLSLTLAAASELAAQVLYDASDPARVYYGTDTRAVSILIGAALAAGFALWGAPKRTRSRQALEVAAGVAAITLAIAWTRLSGSSRLLYRGGFLACAVAVAVVIAAAVDHRRGPVAQVLSVRPLRGLGVISYGVYLWHWPVFVWFDEQRMHCSGWPLFAIQCAITLAVALVSYRFVERPIRSGWGAARVMQIGVPVAAGALAVVLVVSTAGASLPVIAGYGGQGVPRVTDASWKRTLAHFRSEAATSGNRERVLVFGDSIAVTLGAIPAGVYTGKRIDGISLGLIGCSLLPTNRVVADITYQQNPHCDGWPALLAQMVEAYRPATVALMLGPWEMFDRETKNGREDAGSPRLTAALEGALGRADAIASAHRARLVILTTPCFDPAPGVAGAQGAVWRDTGRVAWLNRTWASFARSSPDTSIVDLSALLCPAGHPIEDRVGERYRVDGMHFTSAGTGVVWRWLDRHLPAAR